ncbi:Uncharacterised protein [uncultured Clostridium sp.]|nr:Uncharacterised protein [uncultured Clostridium sp.]
MGLCIGPEILQDEVGVRTVAVVRIQQGIIQVTEQLRILGCVITIDQLHQHVTDILIGIEDIHGVVAAMLLIIDNLVCAQTEDKGVFLTHLFYHFHICTVHGSDGQGSVQHELHVTGTGRLLAGGRDLLRYICCSEDQLCVGDTVILDKDNLDLAVNRRVVVDHVCHGVDKLDGQLCAAVACCCLCSEDKGSRIEFHIRMLFDLIIQIHHMQDVQQLTLVLMQSLNLYIEDGARVYGDTVVLLDVFRQTHLVLILDVHEFLLRLLVVCVDFQLADLGQVGDPLVADVVGHPLSQQRIAVKQETTLGNTVGLVVELLRHHLVEILQLLLFQDLCMQSRYAVYRMACRDSQMSHLDLSVVNDSHLADLFLIARIFCLDIQYKTTVDLLHDLVYTGKQTGEQLDRPFLQGLCHDGVVGVSAGLSRYIPCLVPLQAFLVDEDTHQLGYRYSRMGIVQLERRLLVELADVVMISLITGNGLLHAGGNKEILLLQTQLLACHMVVVGVQNLYQQLRQVFFLYGLLIIALVEGVQAEGIHGLCVPDTKGIHYVIAIAYYRKVAGDSPYGLIALLDKMVLAVLIDLYVYVAAELDDLRVLRTAELEGIAVHKPVVGNFFLISVLNFLLEHTIAVTDAAAVCRITQGCQRIQEAGCQSSQTAISQSCVRLLILDYVQIAAQLLQSFLYFVIIG